MEKGIVAQQVVRWKAFTTASNILSVTGIFEQFSGRNVHKTAIL
jgi:hypothetical protein